MTERFADAFTTSLTSAISTTARPATFTVAINSGQLPSGNFSIVIYNVGTDAAPVNSERLIVTAISGFTWTATTEASDTAKTHASGSTLRQILTARSVQQQMVDHKDVAVEPNPHDQYTRKSVFQALGDLLVGTGAGTLIRKATGSDGNVLTADSTAPGGVAWRSSSATVLTTIGDMLYQAVTGAARLPIGSLGQILTAGAKTPLITDPAVAPTNADLGGGSGWATSTAYFFSYAWGNAYGQTLPSPEVTWTSPSSSPVAQLVTIPAAPAGTTNLYLYVRGPTTSGPRLHLGVPIASPSTSSVNQVTVTGPPLSSYPTVVTVNSTGGFGPNWSNGPLTTLGDLIYGGTSGLLTRLGIGTTGQILSVVGGLPAWSRAVDVMTAFGDLIYGGTAGVPTRLGAGTAGQLLQTNGVGAAPTWVPAPTGGSGSGGGSGALVPFGTQIVGAATPSVTMPVPSGAKHLILRFKARDAANATPSLAIRLNGDGGTNYNQHLAEAQASAFAAASSTAQTSVRIGSLNPSTDTAGRWLYGITEIPSHADSDNHKRIFSRSSVQSSGASSPHEYLDSGEWVNTAPVTSITVLTVDGTNLEVGSAFYLFGLNDTSPVLLTANSNLLFEYTVPAGGQATIDTGLLSQSYRDLRITVIARGTTGATDTNLLMQCNGDTGTSYDYTELYGSNTTPTAAAPAAGTSIKLAFLDAGGAPTGNATACDVTIPSYSASTFRKTGIAHSTLERSDTPSANNFVVINRFVWRNTAPITSLQFLLAAGNFAAGSSVRICGEPASAGGASTGTGTRARLSANQSIATATATTILFDTEDSDADNQHFTSVANLTGTVAKTAASQALAGTGTAFTTELSIGQVISVPGTAAEKAVVTNIASNTALTVAKPFVNTASGQTAARINSAFVFRQPGTYSAKFGAYMAAAASGTVIVQIKLNDTTVIGEDGRAGVNAANGHNVAVIRPFQQWDFVEAVVTQSSGGSVNLTADERTHFEVNARPTVIVAVPYVCLKDTKAQNTAGGTFTSGADRTRDLQTVDSDSSGLVTLVANQFTLPGGSYEYNIMVPGYQCGSHQAFLYNFTDTVEVKRGTSETSGVTSATTTWSRIDGKMTTIGAKTFEIRHRCATTSTTNGFGLPANFAAETYTVATFRKVG